MAWIREGECNHCGSCCRGCVHHDDKAMRCKDRQSEIYLSGCNVFPTHPRQVALNPGCSYSFRWIEDVPNPYSWDGWEAEFAQFGEAAPWR